MTCAVFGFAFGGSAVVEYTKNQCRMSFAQSNKTAEDIAKICK